MRIVTYNVNGIRAADRRGFRDWLSASQADVLALQEVRCRLVDLPVGVFGDYHVVYNPGSLAGRNGVALLTRQAPAAVFGWANDLLTCQPEGDFVSTSGPMNSEPTLIDVKADNQSATTVVIEADNPWFDEGRLVGVELAEAPLTIISVYVPKGGVPVEVAPPAGGGREGYTPEQNQARYDRKMAFLELLAKQLQHWQAQAQAKGRQLLIMGDYNIAHGPADLKNWKTNLASEGFLPAERAWLDAVVGPAASTPLLEGKKILASTLAWQPIERHFIDVVRTLRPDDEGPYSWWSWRGQAFNNDVGWRIDYHLATAGLAAAAKQAWVERADDFESRISDHAPVIVDYDL